MAKKPSVTTIASGFYSTEALNANFTNLKEAFDNTLSLDGSLPNALSADLDLNGNDLLNVGAASFTSAIIAGVDFTVKASEAAASASAAATSASNAATSATTALNSLTGIDQSEANALAYSVSAGNSATAATLQASNAATSASTAESAETNAEASAINSEVSRIASEDAAALALANKNAAATSASAASGSATSAQASADAALSALDSFDDRYLGQKTSDPTLDNDGNALVAGALYFDTVLNIMKVYDGSVWVAAYASLSGALIANSNLSDLSDIPTARTNLGLGTAATTASTAYATAAQGTLADSSIQAGDLATVATSGAYSDLTGSPSLASVATSGAYSDLTGKPIVVEKTSNTGSAIVPTGTEAERDGTPVAGYLRFNSEATSFEGYDGSAWGSIGGGATSDAVYENSATILENITIVTGRNGMSTGPISVGAGITVTVESGARYVVI